MPNYKQKTVTGEVVVYLAAAGGRFENPYGGVPLLTFDEVERTVLDGKLIAERPTGRTLRMAASGKNIPFVNVATYDQATDPNLSFPDEQLAYFMACAYIEAARIADETKQSARVDPRARRRDLEPE